MVMVFEITSDAKQHGMIHVHSVVGNTRAQRDVVGVHHRSVIWRREQARVRLEKTLPMIAYAEAVDMLIDHCALVRIELRLWKTDLLAMRVLLLERLGMRLRLKGALKRTGTIATGWRARRNRRGRHGRGGLGRDDRRSACTIFAAYNHG